MDLYVSLLSFTSQAFAEISGREVKGKRNMKSSQIKQGAVLSYIALFVNVMIGLLYTPWLISSIGKSDYGLYTLAMSVIGLLAFDFGLGNATTKFITQYLAEGRQDKVNNLLGLIYKLYLCLDCILLLVFVGMYFFLPQIYTGLTPEELTRFSKVFVIASAFCVLSFPFIPLSGTLASYELFVPLKSCDLFCRVFIVLSMSICLILGYGLYALVLVNSIAGIITIILKLIILKRRTPVKVNLHFWDKNEFRTILSFVVWVTIIALSQRLIFNISPSILGIFSDSQEIAFLGIAITLESYVFMFANALNGLFLPRVSKLLHNKQNSEILELMIKVGRVQIYIIGFICVWLVSFGRHFIDVWVGESFSPVYLCAILIIIPSFLHLPQEIGHTYIVAANKVKKQSYVYVLMGLLNVALSVPLSMKLGSLGICISIFIAYTVRTVGLDFIFYKDLHLDIFTFFKKSFFKLTPLLLGILALALAINRFIPIQGWTGLIVKSVIYLAIFVGLCWILGLNEYEKELFLAPCRSIYHKIKRK